MTTTPPPSSPDPTPNPFEALLKILPVEIQRDVERTLRGFGITSNEDPLVQVMTALALFAVYYEKIPQQVATAGNTIATQNAFDLALLDVRLRELRGVAITIQKATDLLAKAPQEIADKFPAQQVAEELIRQVNAALETLPLTKFELSTQKANANLEEFTNKAERIGTVLESEITRLRKNANDISNLAIPSVSWARACGYFLTGGLLAAFLMWLFVVRADETRITSMVNSEGFIGSRAIAGYYHEQPIIVVPKDYFKDDEIDPANGNLIVHLNN